MWHGEVDKNQTVNSQIHEVYVDMNDQLEDIIYDIGKSSFRKTILYVVARMHCYIRDAKVVHIVSGV